MNFFISFAEDVRQEQHNKMSIMGTLGDNLLASHFPLTVGKVVVVFQGYWEDQPFEMLTLSVKGPREADDFKAEIKFGEKKGPNAFMSPVAANNVTFNEGEKMVATLSVDGRELASRTLIVERQEVVS